MQVADSALGSVVTQLTSAMSLAVAGNSGAESAPDLESIVAAACGHARPGGVAGEYELSRNVTSLPEA